MANKVFENNDKQGAFDAAVESRFTSETGADSYLSRLDLLTGLVFLASGVPALVYQLAWQRVLFTLYGVNIESITVIITAFMIGLGLGSLLGSQLSKHFRRSALAVFAVIELAIGVFGYFSLDIFSAVGHLTWSAGTLATLIVSFALVVIPTTLMGATLPLLVALRVGLTGNVGRSVDIFYFVNTLGAALACFLAVGILFVYVGLSGAVAFSVWVNILLAGTVLSAHLLWSGRISAAMGNATGEEDESPEVSVSNGPERAFLLAALLVGLTGFISISYEIVWARLYGFASKGNPLSFGAMLGFYLLGIALGSYVSRACCETVRSTGNARNLFVPAGFVVIAVIAGFVVPAVLAHLLGHGIPWISTFPVITVTAALWGSLLPILSHFAIRPDEKAGEGLGWLYLCNIVGSAAGGLITGFVLLDKLTFGQVNLVLVVAGLLVVGILISRAGLDKRPMAACLGATVAMGAGLMVLKPALYTHLYDKLYHKKTFATAKSSGDLFTHTVETKSGVITVSRDGMVTGGGAYDGRFNVDFVNDTNRIRRLYAVSLFRPGPRNVLVIGLGSGSWSQVIAHMPSVESVKVVEINGGYLDVIGLHPAVRSLAHNPKVQLIVDHGRRYLTQHPNEKFDLVVINTTFHWRAYISNLLSAEFFGMVRDHLTDDGLFVFNTTGSEAAQKTALTVFRHGALHSGNTMYLSQAPVTPNLRRLTATLSDFRIDGKLVMKGSEGERRRRAAGITRNLASSILPAHNVRGQVGHACFVTDDNMCTEYRVTAKTYFPSIYGLIEPLFGRMSNTGSPARP